MDGSAMNVIHVTDLKYAELGEGPWRIYIFDKDGFHSGGKWFRDGAVKYPDEEVGKEEAYQTCMAAVLLKREVRICDGGDKLVFHSKDGSVIHGERFWGPLGFDLKQMAINAARVEIAKDALSRDGMCISCREPALPKCYSEAGRREYGISGLCEKCFDAI